MLTEPQQKFIDALRSDEFEQGKGMLRTPDNKFCCLGVACEIYHRETGEGEWTRPDNGDWSFDFEESVMPYDVYKWLGLDSSNPNLGETRQFSAADYNDGNAEDADENGVQLNFDEIADEFIKVFEEINAE